MMSEIVVRELLAQIDPEPSREGLEDTPARVVRSWSTLYGGYDMDPAEILSTTFDGERYDQIVLCKDIEFYSTCEHHMLPFFGRAHVAYIPSRRVVGLSKLPRLVECFARRLQIQERMTSQIAKALQEHLQPLGVFVMVEGQHMCMMARGVEQKRASMTTSMALDDFRNADARAEVMGMIK